MNRSSITTKIIAFALVGCALIPVKVYASGQFVAMAKNQTFISQTGIKNPELQKFVEEKVITQEQADKIEAFLKQRTEERKAENEKIKSMTKEQRDNYTKENYKSRPDIFGDLVSSKIITEEQANKIKESLSKKRDNRLQEALQEEVSRGTIKQEQLYRINEFLAKKKEERKAEKAKLSSMTPEERTAYLQNLKKNNKDFLAELATSGIITNEQKESLSKSLPKYFHKYKKPRF